MPEASKKMRAREWSTIVLIASVHALIGLINLMRMQWLKELINLLSTAMQWERESEGKFKLFLKGFHGMPADDFLTLLSNWKHAGCCVLSTELN